MGKLRICTSKKYKICTVCGLSGNSLVYDVGSVCGDSIPSMKDQVVKDLVSSFKENHPIDEEKMRVFFIDEKSSTKFIKGKRQDS